MEYPFKDLLPLDEVLEREGYYKDWTHLDPKVFYSLTQISEYIKTKGFGVDVRLLIAQLAEHFGLSVVEVTDIANSLIARQSAVENRQDAVEVFNNQVIQEMTDKDVISAPEIIQMRDGEATASARLERDFQALNDNVSTSVEALKSHLEDAITERGISIKALGAKSDMSEDASPYIMQALDYVNSPNALTKTVFIPQGKYLINSDILLDGWGFNIIGEGRYSELVAGEGIELAVIRSRSEERVRNTALRSVKIENIHINGDKRDIYGVLMDGFNRGCQFNSNRVTNCAKDQVAINGSWCFTFNYNVIEGIIDGFVSEMNYTGRGLVLGVQTNPIFYRSVGVNMPTIIGNSFQYLEVGLLYRYGMSCVITGNTFESTLNGYTVLQYVKGGIYQGNYHEVNKNGGGVRIGLVSEAESPLMGFVFSGNIFEAKQTGSTAEWHIDAMINSTIENNFYVDTNREMVVGSYTTSSNTYGNRIQYTAGKLYENSKLDRAVNMIYNKKMGD